MLFSILIANHNNGIFFKDCYESIIAQSCNNWEVIIIDDGSTDNSIEIIKQCINNDNRFKLYTNDKNFGCGYTKRKCIELASGELCGFLDPDDTLFPDALQSMVNEHAQHANASMIYSRCNRVNENFTKILSNGEEIVQVVNQDSNFLNQEGNIGHFTTFKKDFYNKTSGINPYLKRAVDQDLYLKLYEAGSAVFLNKILYNYRIHNRGISTLKNRNKARYWFWIAMIDAAERRNIDLEEMFGNEFMQTKDCWATKNEVKSNPIILLKKLYLSLKNKIKS